MKYLEIPKAERKRLEVEVYRRSARLRAIRLVAILLPILFSSSFAALIVAENDPMIERIAAKVFFALLLCVVIWASFGRRALKLEVERLKNA